MENELKLLFDFQRFMNNDRLAQVIAKAEKGCGEALNDDELSFVSAAGELAPTQRRGKDGDDTDV